MAEVTVFVDDAVLGRLPEVCARDGVATTSSMRTRRTIGSTADLGVLWLLIFAGPLGWLALLFVMASRRSGDHLDVELPYSERAYQRLVDAGRLRNLALLYGAVGAISLAVLTRWAGLGQIGAGLVLGVGIVALVVAAVGEWRRSRESLTVDLDASRRWVTLGRVHPDFATACRSQSEYSRTH